MFSLAVGIYYAFKDRKKLVDNYYFGGRNMSPVIMFYLPYILQAGRVSRQLRGVEKYCFCWLHQLHPNDFDESTEQKLLYIGATDSLLQNCFDDNRNKLFIYVNLFPDLVHPFVIIFVTSSSLATPVCRGCKKRSCFPQKYLAPDLNTSIEVL